MRKLSQRHCAAQNVSAEPAALAHRIEARQRRARHLERQAAATAISEIAAHLARASVAKTRGRHCGSRRGEDGAIAREKSAAQRAPHHRAYAGVNARHLYRAPRIENNLPTSSRPHSNTWRVRAASKRHQQNICLRRGISKMHALATASNFWHAAPLWDRRYAAA